MKTPTRILFCVLVLLLLAAENNLAAENPDNSIISHTADGQVILRSRRPSGGVADFLPYAPDELLVRFKDNIAPAAKSAVHARHKAIPIKRFRHTRNLELVKLPQGADLHRALKSYRDQRDVLYAEPNYLVEQTSVIISNPGTPPPVVIPNDPSFPLQWNLHNTGQDGGTPGADIKAAEAWSITTGSNDVVVAVIDSGIDYNHQDLAANMWRNEADCNNNGIDDDGNGYIDDCYGIDTFNDDSDPMDDNNHGTHVAGIIGAVGNNNLGVVGVNWNVKIMACKFMGADGFGTVGDAIDCLEYVQTMKDRGVNVVATNNSWGSYGYSQALYDAIDAQHDRGILFVAAAGNTDSDNDLIPIYPASYKLPNVVSVSATAFDDRPRSFSNFGATSVHVYAPGVDIISTTPGNTYSSFSGTSMAAAHVTGVAALLKAQDGNRDWRAIKNLILSSGDTNPAHPLVGSITQMRLNAYRALNCSNSTVVARLRPESKNVIIGIAPIDLSVLHLNCAKPNGSVAVIITPVVQTPFPPAGQTVVLADDGIGPDRFAGDGEYSGSWLPSAGGTYTISFPDGDRVTVTVDPDLKRGFPVKALHTAGSYLGGAALQTLVGNIDSSPDQEIIVTGLASGPLYAWKSDGSVVPGWPLDEITTASYPALGRLSDVPDALDVVSSQLDGSIIARSGSGAHLMSWSSRDHGTTMLTTADINGDGVDEVIFADGSYVHIEQMNGMPLTGWPISPGPGLFWSVAVADLDGDKIPEIIFVDGYLHVFHSNGAPVAGFPVWLGFNFFSTAVVGDVDGDGKPEIVTVGFAGDPLSPVVRVLIVSNQGTVKQDFTGSGVALSAGPPALADLDGDGIPEIIVQTSGMLHVWKGNGTALPGWPVPLSGRWDQSSPVVGDVDGDGLPDVVIVSRGELLVFNRNGELHRGFPKIFSQGDIGAITPAIADIDLDGHNEIIVTSYSWTGQEGEFYKVWVYDLGGPPHGPILWGQVFGGPKHQGYYAPTESRWLVVNKIGSGNGTVSSNLPGIDCGVDCAKEYAVGTTVSLSAVPDAGSTFSGWSGGCNGVGNCVVRIDSNETVAAIFTLPLGFNLPALPNGEVGLNYKSSFTPDGGLPPYRFAVTRGSLPPGLSLGSPIVQGTPTRAGTYKFTIQVTDQLQGSVTQSLQIRILKALAISTKSLKTGRVNRTYSARLAASGGQGPYSWSLVSGTLPDGLLFDPSTGSIAGTPAAAATADLAFQVSDALGGTSQRSLTLTVK